MRRRGIQRGGIREPCLQTFGRLSKWVSNKSRYYCSHRSLTGYFYYSLSCSRCRVNCKRYTKPVLSRPTLLKVQCMRSCSSCGACGRECEVTDWWSDRLQVNMYRRWGGGLGGCLVESELWRRGGEGEGHVWSSHSPSPQLPVKGMGGAG